jgi:hypothetical protein
MDATTTIQRIMAFRAEGFTVEVTPCEDGFPLFTIRRSPAAQRLGEVFGRLPEL